MRIEVEPDVLVQSGQKLGSIGSQLGMLAHALGEALGSGIASGIDPAGANFGIKYGRQAEDFAKAMADATDAHEAVGFMLRATGYNYENADAVSTIGGSGPAGSVGTPPDKSPIANAKGINDVMVPPPAKWALIQTFLGPSWSWPSGNASMMRITAAQWRNFATGLSAFDNEMSALKNRVSQQHIPEAGKIGEALADLAKGVASLAESATGMAKAVDDFASGVQETQEAIRDLMDRLSLDGLWDTVTGFLTGDGDDILREVAHDVKELLENFQSQVKGVVGLLGELTALLGSAADAFEKWVRPILVEAFGDDVGNALADYTTWNTDVGVGAVTGLLNTVSGVVSLADLDTWKGMAEVAASIVEDPTKLPGVLENMGKEFVAWDKWSGDHPGRAAGEAAFNIGTLLVPGGALTKGGSVAKSLSYASRLFEEGRLPRISDLPGLGSARHDVPELEGLSGAGRGLPNVPEFTPGPVPAAVVGPIAPNVIDAPTSPARLTDPGGPPDPPGRPSGPLDSEPGGIDGPSPNRSSASNAPASAGTSSESHSPTEPYDDRPSTDQPGTTSTASGPTVTPQDAGRADGQPGSGVESENGYRPVDGALGASHLAGADDVGARPRELAPPPTALHTAEVPADTQSSRHASAGPENDRTLAQPQTTVDGVAKRDEVAGAAPVMTGAGVPAAQGGAPGQPHTRVSASTSATETGTGNGYPKTPQGDSSGGTQQRSPAAGPGSEAGRTPTAPVQPATTPLAPSSDPGNLARQGQDSRASRSDSHEVAGRTDGTGSESVSAGHAIGPDGRYKLSGHGDYRESDGTTIVPEGTTFTTYAEHGSPITDALGNLIETGGDTSRVYSRTYLPGDEVPNYILYPPEDLTVLGTPHTVTRPTLISELLRPNMGDVDFAACLGGWSDRAFDVDCVYDRRTYQPIYVYPRPIVEPDEPW